MSDPAPPTDRRDERTIALIAVAAYLLYGLAWPLHPVGKDYVSYVQYFFDLFRPEPSSYILATFRTPGAPLVIGLLGTLGGATGLWLGMAAGYVASILAVYRLGRRLEPAVGRLAAGLLIAYPGHAELMLTLGADSIFAVGLCLWAAMVAATPERPTVGRFALHGLAVFGLVMIRPAALGFVLFASFPLLVRRLSWPQRLGRGAVFVVVLLALVKLWSVHNGLRYETWSLGRESGATLPFYRTLVQIGTVRAGNGPASAELAELVERELLTREPYASLGMTADEFFAGAYTHGDNPRLHDLRALCNLHDGWDSEYARLKAAGLEAVKAAPGVYAKSVVTDYLALLNQSFDVSPTPDRVTPPPPYDQPVEAAPGQIPYRALDVESTAPAGRHADLATANEWYQSSVFSRIPTRRPFMPLRLALVFYAALFPAMTAWLFVGLLGTWRLERGEHRVLWFMVAMGLALLAATLLGLPPHVRYRQPFDPLFILLGAAGLMNLRAALCPRTESAD